MPWRVKVFYSERELEDYLNSLALEPDQVTSLESVVQGPRNYVRLVAHLVESQVQAEEAWSARVAVARTKSASGARETPA